MSMRRFSTLVLCAFVCIHCSYSTVQGSSCLTCREMQMQENCTTSSVVLKSREGCRGGAVWGSCGCCKVCGKVENESCGGVNGSEGLCDNSLRCTAPRKEFLGGANLTGICLPRVCLRNCSRKPKKLLCGTDGRWYRNNCARRQHNCFVPDSEKVNAAVNNQICENACAELMAPDHGNLSLTNGLLHGSVATYACAPEFVLNSLWLATATCQHGRWTRVPPRCIPFDPCDNIQCPSGARCVHNGNSSTSCVCKLLTDCPQESQPVCGSDGKTYQSECHLQVTACISQTAISTVRSGNCPELTNNHVQESDQELQRRETNTQEDPYDVHHIR